MNSLKLGLVISIIIGSIIALFPLHSNAITTYIWSEAEHTDNEDTYIVRGSINCIDLNNSILIVNGVRVLVRGYWIIEGGDETLYSSEVLPMLQEGLYVTVEYSESGRWGFVAEMIVVEPENIVLVRQEG